MGKIEHKCCQWLVGSFVNPSLQYQKQKNDQYRSMLYDQYLKWLENNAKIPDSVDIIKYYQKLQFKVKKNIYIIQQKKNQKKFLLKDF